MALMAFDERNFRSTYYEKVGFKSVEENKTLEILLKEKHLDIPKLKKFCLRFSVPPARRNHVWKLLLGILPLQEGSSNFVTEQRREEFLNLLHALQIMKLVKNVPKNPQTFVSLWLLQAGRLHFNVNTENKSALLAIVEYFLNTNDGDLFDVYWFSKCFYDAVQKFQCEVPKLIEAVHILLEKEDVKLHKHLIRIEALENLPFQNWFECCFAGVLNEIFLGKIWDKICAGTFKILIYVAVVILTSLKHKLMTCNNLETVLMHMKTISEDAGEVIVNKSIELWQQQGNPLTVYDKPKPQIV